MSTGFAIVLLENDRNELLFLKRRDDAVIGGGQWGFPAGHIEAGETPEHCAQRELAEETGILTTRPPVNHIGPLLDTRYGGEYELHLYHQRWNGNEVNLNNEHTAYAWVGREDYHLYQVVDGIDEDILYCNIWPRQYLNEAKLPKS